MAKKLRKLLFRILILLFILGNISACLHGCSATRYKAGATPGPPFTELNGLDKWKAVFLGRRIARPENSRNPAEVNSKLNPRAEMINQSGGNIAYWVVDAPNPKGIVIALPDYGQSSDDMLEAAGIFNALGYSVAAIDFRGTGKSEGKTTTLGKRESIDVEVIYKRISQKNPGVPILLYGGPMGAGAAMKSQYFGRITPAACIYEAPYGDLTKFSQARIADAGMPKFLSLPILIWGGAVNQMNPFNFSPERFASGVECPVLFLRGENDTRVTEDDLAVFAEQVPDELGSQKSIAGADHSQILSRANPDEWSKEVRSFLATLDRQGARNMPSRSPTVTQDELPASPAYPGAVPSRSNSGAGAVDSVDAIEETIRTPSRPAVTPATGKAGEWKDLR